MLSSLYIVIIILITIDYIHSSGVGLQQTKEKRINIKMQLFFLKWGILLKYKVFYKEKSVAFRLQVKVNINI